ncbi:hypothetical protein CIW52_15570 [Mycolicibacterium sp. P9-64]|uniref:hypothetical protein n=1 Tax=Mycolicibacterium sp. P9-64 TaxID=2024612 RepID=UPI0011ED00ED|nr:hypothetical protein [Mycolicibacterium sp. P9-64]KAA0082422.1 hypothetical protein CIW52_15570 [Mycolicibacterium sp. P9-64]
MSIQYGEASLDELVTPLPRKRRSSLYPAHSGVGRQAASSEPETPRPQTRSRQRPPHAADLAQSRLFEALLLDDIDELEDRAATAERRWQRRRERKLDDVETPPHDLKQLRQQIAEARRLLDALYARFPPE